MPKSRISGSHDNFILSFWAPSILFSIVVAPIYIPTDSVGGLGEENLIAVFIVYIDMIVASPKMVVWRWREAVGS